MLPISSLHRTLFENILGKVGEKKSTDMLRTRARDGRAVCSAVDPLRHRCTLRLPAAAAHRSQSRAAAEHEGGGRGGERGMAAAAGRAASARTAA